MPQQVTQKGWTTNGMIWLKNMNHLVKEKLIIWMKKMRDSQILWLVTSKLLWDFWVFRCWLNLCCAWKYPLAPACQGHQGCGFWILSDFQQSSVQLSAIQPSAVKLFTGPKFHVIDHRHPMNSGSRSALKINQFSSLSPGQQKSEKLFPRPQGDPKKSTTE